MPHDHATRTSYAFTDKRALVSGSGKGIGYEIAVEFARNGADVVVHYSRGQSGAQAAVEEIERLGRRATAIRADFDVVSDVQRLGTAAVEFLGGLDILVNNAGITWNRPFDQVTVEQFDRVYNVNIRAPFFLTQACLPALKEARGAIINITSIHGIAGCLDHSVYAGTKGAIIAWTRELAIELAPHGVRVNGIAPGSVFVEAHALANPGADPVSGGENIPCGFIGQPPDIAKLAAFLASDDARYIVGQTLVADGGTTSWMPFGTGYKQPMTGQFGRGYVPDTE
jgi:NAD(P)-dependent dehydrogenase (short-subunit alcohol dehydrogenase family)